MEDVLDFVNKEYSLEELGERVRQYLKRTQQVKLCIRKNDDSSAFKLFRGINKDLHKEYRAYTRATDTKVIRTDKNAKIYKAWIADVIANNPDRVTKASVPDSVANVIDYAGYHFPEVKLDSNN